MEKPTIGIEIELPWQYMLDRVDPEAAELFRAARNFWNLPEEGQERVSEAFDEIDAQYKDRINDMFSDDIGRGKDSYVEFALRPKHEAEELVQVTSRLFEADILRDDEVYSLHVTLGNVKFTQSAWLALMAAEVSGGTTPERIRQQNTWERKGQAGIQRRLSSELIGATQGFEMRTLALSGLEGLRTTLEVAQTIGALLVSREAGSTESAEVLRELYRHLMQGTREKGIDASVRWANPAHNPEPWLQMSEALTDTDWQNYMQKGVLELL